MLALSWGKVDNDDSETRINGPVRGLSRRTACSGRAVAHNRTPIRGTRYKRWWHVGSGKGDGGSSKVEKANTVLVLPSLACQPRTKPYPPTDCRRYVARRLSSASLSFPRAERRSV